MKKMLLTLAVLAMLVGCRSQKKVVKTEIATADTCSVSSASTLATERLRWMDSLTLDLDSFEIEWRMALDHFADIGKMMGDTAMVASRSSAVTVTDGFAQSTAQPRTGSVVLRAKHASVGKVGRLERNSASCSQHIHCRRADGECEDYHSRTYRDDMGAMGHCRRGSGDVHLRDLANGEGR